jgi:hypothetical protein
MWSKLTVGKRLGARGRDKRAHGVLLRVQARQDRYRKAGGWLPCSRLPAQQARGWAEHVAERLPRGGVARMARPGTQRVAARKHVGSILHWKGGEGEH